MSGSMGITTEPKQSELLEQRFMRFSVSVIRFVSAEQSLPRSVMDQVTRSATSIGANYAEAQNAASRSDFRNKVFIAKKEAAETRYWLRLIGELTSREAVHPYLQEIQAILMILQKIINTVRSKPAT